MTTYCYIYIYVCVCVRVCARVRTRVCVVCFYVFLFPKQTSSSYLPALIPYSPFLRKHYFFLRLNILCCRLNQMLSVIAHTLFRWRHRFSAWLPLAFVFGFRALVRKFPIRILEWLQKQIPVERLFQKIYLLSLFQFIYFDWSASSIFLNTRFRLLISVLSNFHSFVILTLFYFMQ